MNRTTAGSRARLAVLAVALAGLAFLAGTVLAPVLEDAGRPAGGWLRILYAPACHQLPERSIAVGGGTQAVCARCSGLYVGGVAGLLAGVVLAGTGRRPRPCWLALAVAPTVLDALLPWIGLAGLPNVPRLLLAVPAGAMAALFLAAGIAEIAGSRPRRRPPDLCVLPVTPALEEPDG